MLTFPSDPTTCGTFRRPQLVSPRRAPKIDFLRPSPKLNYCFFFKSPKSSALPGMTSFTSPVIFPIWGFYCDIFDCHIHPARVNTCTQLTRALTNPCTKRKVLSLTKPKGKIYKTKNDNIKKSLRNYITPRSSAKSVSEIVYARYPLLFGFLAVEF